MSNDATKVTLQYYANKAKDFSEDTQTVNFSNIQQEFLKYIPQGGMILDLGCGAGRDSKAFIDAGYNVVAMDGSLELCQIASKYIGQEVICATFQEFSSTMLFDGIWACASLLHISMDDLKTVMPKLVKILKKGGCFYISFKYGDFSGIRNGRFFTDMTELSFESLISSVPDVKVDHYSITGDVRPGRGSEKWLNIFLKKI
jgi:SAM-dependent methyltransferase